MLWFNARTINHLINVLYVSTSRGEIAVVQRSSPCPREDSTVTFPLRGAKLLWFNSQFEQPTWTQNWVSTSRGEIAVVQRSSRPVVRGFGLGCFHFAGRNCCGSTAYYYWEVVGVPGSFHFAERNCCGSTQGTRCFHGIQILGFHFAERNCCDSTIRKSGDEPVRTPVSTSRSEIAVVQH